MYYQNKYYYVLNDLPLFYMHLQFHNALTEETKTPIRTLTQIAYIYN